MVALSIGGFSLELRLLQPPPRGATPVPPGLRNLPQPHAQVQAAQAWGAGSTGQMPALGSSGCGGPRGLHLLLPRVRDSRG